MDQNESKEQGNTFTNYTCVSESLVNGQFSFPSVFLYEILVSRFYPNFFSNFLRLFQTNFYIAKKPETWVKNTLLSFSSHFSAQKVREKGKRREQIKYKKRCFKVTVTILKIMDKVSLGSYKK